MKIIKRTDRSDLVVFAGPNLTLNGQVVTGNGWTYTAPVNWAMVLEEAVLPEGYVSGGWTYTNGVWAINATGSAAFLPGLRRAKIESLTASSLAAEYEDITYDALVWAADDSARYLLTQALAVGSVPVGMYWRDADGVPHDVTYAYLQGLALKMAERALAIDEQLTSKMAIVEAASTAAAIRAVVWV